MTYYNTGCAIVITNPAIYQPDGSASTTFPGVQAGIYVGAYDEFAFLGWIHYRVLNDNDPDGTANNLD